MSGELARTPGRSVVTFTSGGRERSYVQYVPAGATPGEPGPLVIDITAYAPATLEESFSGFTKPDTDGRIMADEVGAVVLTPEPVNGGGALLTWNYVGTDGWTDDQQFFADLLDRAQAQHCIDERRVLVMGFAVGAVMGSIVTCEQADRIAALVTVSGLYSPDDCEPARPVPVLSFHGTGDRFVPFDGGVGAGAGNLGLDPETVRGLVFMAARPGARASSQAWADHDGCTGAPEEQPAGAGVTHVAWTTCRDGATVELYVIDGGEHTWPGSNGMAVVESLLGPTSQAIDANDVIWTFFETHAPPASG